MIPRTPAEVTKEIQVARRASAKYIELPRGYKMYFPADPAGRPSYYVTHADGITICMSNDGFNVSGQYSACLTWLTGQGILAEDEVEIDQTALIGLIKELLSASCSWYSCGSKYEIRQESRDDDSYAVRYTSTQEETMTGSLRYCLAFIGKESK